MIFTYMVILGIESTAHTFGVGIITSEGKILANVKDSFTSTDIGMIPGEIAQHHKEVADSILAKSLEEASVTWDDIEFIAYSAGPGLDPVLWEGYHKAKEWSKKYEKKLVGVNHCCAHLSIGKLWNKLEDPCYLYVSGVNTQIIVSEGGKYRVIGETLDIGLGNMLDKFARLIDLGFPGGPLIEKMATGKYVELPYTVKGMDVSFSGLLTKAKQLYERTQASKEDLCFSLQETAFAMLAEVVERAMANTGKKELLLVGGVGANKRFCEMLDVMCQERGATFYKVPMDLAGDQGAMIAWEGFLRQNESGDMEVNPHWRADEV
jgi:N6-L-threonylcarbamoyladenine synthase